MELPRTYRPAKDLKDLVERLEEMKPIEAYGYGEGIGYGKGFDDGQRHEARSTGKWMLAWFILLAAFLGTLLNCWTFHWK